MVYIDLPANLRILWSWSGSAVCEGPAAAFRPLACQNGRICWTFAWRHRRRSPEDVGEHDKHCRSAGSRLQPDRRQNSHQCRQTLPLGFEPEGIWLKWSIFHKLKNVWLDDDLSWSTPFIARMSFQWKLQRSVWYHLYIGCSMEVVSPFNHQPAGNFGYQYIPIPSIYGLFAYILAQIFFQ